jgi:ribosomal protein S18 acetylase RimI-like enzyme
VEDLLLPLLVRIEESHLKLAAKNREVIAVSSFLALIDPVYELTWLNYAVPVEPLGTSAAVIEVIEELREVFRESDRTLRFEFTKSLCPELPAILEQAGLNLESHHPMLICTPDQFQPSYASNVDVKFVDVDNFSGLETFFTLRHRGFYGDLETEETSLTDIAELRQQIQLGQQRVALAYFDGIPAGVGVTMPMSGVGELSSIATLPEFRRRGVAKTLCSFLIKDHFESGGDLVWLAAGNAIAKATYESIGFRVVASRIHYIDAIVINSKSLLERIL